MFKGKGSAALRVTEISPGTRSGVLGTSTDGAGGGGSERGSGPAIGLERAPAGSVRLRGGGGHGSPQNYLPLEGRMRRGLGGNSKTKWF